MSESPNRFSANSERRGRIRSLHFQPPLVVRYLSFLCETFQVFAFGLHTDLITSARRSASPHRRNHLVPVSLIFLKRRLKPSPENHTTETSGAPQGHTQTWCFIISLQSLAYSSSQFNFLSLRVFWLTVFHNNFTHYTLNSVCDITDLNKNTWSES